MNGWCLARYPWRIKLGQDKSGAKYYCGFGSLTTICKMVSSLRSLHFNDFPKLYFDSIKCSHAFVLKLWIFQRCSQFKQISFHRLFVASYFWCPCLSGPWEDTGRDRYAHSLGVCFGRLVLTLCFPSSPLTTVVLVECLCLRMSRGRSFVLPC